MRSKSFIPFATMLCIAVNTLAQPFDIGHSSIVFYDSERDRDIETEVYYPADNGGEDVVVASGDHPVLVFGHGFLMSWESYENFWMELVPEGYVICFPRTEMGFSPSHLDFGLDLRFTADQMQNENEDNSSLFYNTLSPSTCLMGHSMGGGASFLAAADNMSISTLVNFAAAETSPSATDAAATVEVPTLLFAGTEDCVTPPSEHQSPMYENLGTQCRYQIDILGGGHCYFADFNLNCSFGETFCGPSIDITREEQQAITFGFLKLWLDHFLNVNSLALLDFNESLQSSTQIDFSQACINTSLDNTAIDNDPIFFPDPNTDILSIRMSDEKRGGTLLIYDLSGKQVFQERILKANEHIDLSDLAKGNYVLIYTKDMFSYSDRWLKF